MRFFVGRFRGLVAIVVALVATLMITLETSLVGSTVFFIVVVGRILSLTHVLDDWNVTGVVVHRVRPLLHATVGKMGRVIAVNDASIVFVFGFVLKVVEIHILDMVIVIVGLGFISLELLILSRCLYFT